MNTNVDSEILVCRSKVLVEQLIIRRLPNQENELCSLARRLSEGEKLVIVETLRTNNVRLAAIFAARVNLSVLQQTILLKAVLREEKSNAIKYFIEHLFSNRLGRRKIFRILWDNKGLHPHSVHLAAYYCLSGSRSWKPIYREKFLALTASLAPDSI
jgi:hypothetical protein